MQRGKFITFEGGEGSGKSTQARLLADHLAAKGIEVVVTREPGGTPYGELIRKLILGAGGSTTSPLAEYLLFSAARAEHLDAKIRPALARGVWVVCDRFLDSSRVYQGAMWKVDARTIADVERHVVGTEYPDLTLLLDLPAEAGLERMRKRSESNRIDGNDLAFHTALRQAYLKLARAEPARFNVIDGNRSAEAVADSVWAEVLVRLPLPTTS